MTPAMEYATLGAAGPAVSRLGFGGEPLGGTDWGAVDPDLAREAVARALDLGFTLFDTADAYGLGTGERALSAALGARRRDVVVVTKFGIAWDDPAPGARARVWRDIRPARVVAALEASLRRLDLERIPLYLVHWPDGATPVEETVAALARQVDAGKVGAIGLSNFDAAAVRRAHAVHPLACVEVEYSAVKRAADAELLPLCAALGIGVLAYGALCQGLLTGKFTPATRFGPDDRRHRLPEFTPEGIAAGLAVAERLRRAADGDRSAAAAAIRWALDHPAVTAVIVGATRPAQVAANAEALGWRYPAGGRP